MEQSNPINVVSIVEGHGEVEAVPILIRRLVELMGLSAFTIAKPIRMHRNEVMKDEQLRRALQLAYYKVQPPGFILILMDADDDCPKELGPQLLARANSLQGNIPISTVIVQKEFEAFFLASIVSLRGFRGITMDAESPVYPEAIRDAKQHLTNLMENNKRYSSRVDQPAFTTKFDMNEALLKSPSLQKLQRELRKQSTVVQS